MPNFNPNDFHEVLEAVTQNGYALCYASDTLQNNPTIVHAAVTRSGYTLRYASDTLQNDPTILLLAIQNGANYSNYTQILQFLDPETIAYIYHIFIDKRSGNKSIDYRNDEKIIRDTATYDPENLLLKRY